MEEKLYLQKTEIVRWQNGKHQLEDDFLSIEEPLAIEVNGQRVAVLMRLPGAEKELAVGFLLSEGILANVKDIYILAHCGSVLPGEKSDDSLTPSRNVVSITAKSHKLAPDAAMLLIRSGCGRTSVEDIAEDLPKITNNLKIKIAVLTAIAKKILDLQEVRKLAGGVHLAALFDPMGELIIAHEDVGRHNAADKVIGYALINKIPLAQTILYNTGRASYELITKCARMNIPIIASKSSPTSLAVEFAKNAGATLCGFVRPNRANIYSGAERIEF